MKNRFGLKGMVLPAVLLMFTVGIFGVVGCASEESGTEPPQAEEPATGGTETPATGGIDAQAVIEEQCTMCHSVARIYLQPDATQWDAIIETMDQRHVSGYGGDPMPADRRAAIVDFMKSRTYSEGEQVVRDKCTSCHELSNITKQAMDVDWVTIVNRMVGEHDASLTVEEQQSAINFLKGE